MDENEEKETERERDGLICHTTASFPLLCFWFFVFLFSLAPTWSVVCRRNALLCCGGEGEGERGGLGPKCGREEDSIPPPPPKK